MFKQPLKTPRASVLGVLASVLLSAPAWATEELTVYGADAAINIRAAQERFRSDMAAYRQSLDSELRDALQAELEQSVSPLPLLVANARSRNRG